MNPSTVEFFVNRSFSFRLLPLLGLALIGCGLVHAAGENGNSLELISLPATETKLVIHPEENINFIPAQESLNSAVPSLPLVSADSSEEVKANPFPQFDDMPTVLQYICLEYLNIGELESIQQIKPELKTFIQGLLLKTPCYQEQYEVRFDQDYAILELLLLYKNRSFAVLNNIKTAFPDLKASPELTTNSPSRLKIHSHFHKAFQTQNRFFGYQNLHRLMHFYFSFRNADPKTLSPELGLYHQYDQLLEHYKTEEREAGELVDKVGSCGDCDGYYCMFFICCCPCAVGLECVFLIHDCGLECRLCCVSKPKITSLKRKLSAAEHAIDTLPNPHPLDFLFENAKAVQTQKTIQGPPQYQSDPSLDEKKLPAQPVVEPTECGSALQSIELIKKKANLRKVLETLRVVNVIQKHYGSANP